MIGTMTHLSARRIAAMIEESIEKITAEQEAMPPEERLRQQQADFIKSMEAIGVRGHFDADPDKFIITEMPCPVLRITMEIAQTIQPEILDKEPEA